MFTKRMKKCVCVGKVHKKFENGEDAIICLHYPLLHIITKPYEVNIL